MKEVEPRSILKEAADCFKNARKSVIEAAPLLHRIFTEKLFLSDYTSFEAYVEDECQISPSYASKLIKAYDHYVIQGGLSQAKLEGTDPEKLYMAISLTGTPEKQLVQAQTLSRRELKQEIHSDENGEECTHPGKICVKCHIRLE